MDIKHAPPISRIEDVPPTGIYSGVPWAKYLDWPANNNTLLGHAARSPAHAKAYMDGLLEDKETPAKRFGRAAHMALLEPDLFRKRYVAEAINRRTNVGKTRYAKIELSGQTVLTPDEGAILKAMVTADYNNPKVAALLDSYRGIGGPSLYEISLIWYNSAHGSAFPCKARIDFLCPALDAAAPETRQHSIIEYKTAASADHDVFQRDMYKYGYHRQAAFYADGLIACADLSTEPLVWFVVQEKTPPYAIAIYLLDDEAIAAGRAENNALLTTLATCTSTGVWPGYNEDKATTISLPSWVRARIAELPDDMSETANEPVSVG